MPISADIQGKIDNIRNILFGGGFPNPINNAEQLSYLFFFYLAEQLDENNKDTAEINDIKYTSFFTGENQKFRWNKWTVKKGDDLVKFTRDEVFPFFEDIAKSAHLDFMAQSRLSIDDPAILSTILEKVSHLELEKQDTDTKGDLFEYILKQIGASGELGQFRTPRHIIRAIVKIANPQKNETIYDPSCGTAGFLSEAYQHILLQNSDPKNLTDVQVDGKTIKRGTGDLLKIQERTYLQNSAFMGTDVDTTMVRLASMNMMLRGLANAKIIKVNPLTKTIDRSFRGEHGMPVDGVDLILANPPFAGRIDDEQISGDVKVGNTKATEILFLQYMLNQLNENGRVASIVPDGVLFSSSNAHKSIREKLLNENTLNAVISLPAGAFQPYAGVKCSVLIFNKGGKTENVQFLDIENDGYKLDSKHSDPIADDDLPIAIENYKNRDKCLTQWNGRNTDQKWENKYWFATIDEINAKDGNLSANTYKPVFREKIVYDDPSDIMNELQKIDNQISQTMDKLKKVL